jgi:hypothetical protein
VTQARFLHIEDTLAIGKLRFFGGSYERGEGMSAHVTCFVNTADARVILTALKMPQEGYRYKEYKGTPPSSQRPAESRVLSVAVKGEVVYLELKSGPGNLTSTGAITPAGQATTAVTISFKRHEAQRLAETVLAYLRAWDVLRLLTHQEWVSPPPRYLLVPNSSETNGAAVNGAMGRQRPFHRCHRVMGSRAMVTAVPLRAMIQPNYHSQRQRPGGAVGLWGRHGR